MLPRIDYIKQGRIRLGMTQRELASLSGISTSMINQIESGRCKPSYDTAKKIFEVLSSQEGKTSLKAGDICSKEVISVQKDEKLEVAIEKMMKNSISQIPVFDVSKIVGLVSEDILARKVLESDDKKNIHQVPILQIMEAPPPIVDIATPAKALIPLVRFTKCVLVSRRGEITGIITISDTLKMAE
ncbi:MAG TPA: CBS domain-containing protein [Nitrososphaeraceae archaeon]|jgi:predicted transcriptional regulator|nr:CBS domain-containing protein [Nitrososphaeraceae archaeon]